MNDHMFDLDPIYSYTREQALLDGVLVDLNRWIPINESGYKYPVACTSTVFAIIKEAVESGKYTNDYKGVVWDILWMSRAMPIEKWPTGQLFKVAIRGVGKRSIFTLKIECSGGDDGEPVLTIMLPDED